MNPPHPASDPEPESEPSSAELGYRQPSVPAREQVAGPKLPRGRERALARWHTEPGLPDSSLEEAGSSSESKHSRLRYYLMTAACAVILPGMAVAAFIFQHYANQARKYDLTRIESLNQGARAVDRHGNFIGSLFADDRKFVKISEVPATLREALLATEDVRFYSHGGVDVRGILRATLVNLRRFSVRQGGSTITQQLVRQAFGLRGRTFQRKLLETCLAIRLEKAYSKDQILEAYLNQIYLGSGFYGVGAAARGYFGKTVSELTLEESALLVGIIKAPVSMSPYRSLEAAQRTRNLTIDRLVELEKIDPVTGADAKLAPVEVKPEGTRFDRPSYVIAAVERELEAGKRRDIRDAVTVTVDVELQAKVDALLKEHVERVEAEFRADADPGQPLQAAVVVLDNQTGEILATTGGRDHRTSPFDRALQGQYPAGTAFLPLVYAAALSVIPDAASAWVLDGPLDNRRAMVGGTEGILGEWGAEDSRNFYQGYVPALYALLRGKTGATMRLGYEAGVAGVHEQLQQCGFTSRLREQPSLLLGASEVRVVDMARAYAALARAGKLPPASGLIVSEPAPAGAAEPVRAEGIAFAEPAAAAVRGVLVAALQQPVLQPVLKAAGLGGTSLAGYGGTAHGFTDAWFIGFDQQVTCAVWMGCDTAQSIGQHAWARLTAFPLWAAVMAEATQGGVKGWPLRGGAPLTCLHSGSAATHECIQRKDGSLIPTVAAPGDPRAVPCPHHQRETAARDVSIVGTGEVLRPVRWQRTVAVAQDQFRPIAPREPVVVGPDVYRVAAETP